MRVTPLTAGPVQEQLRSLNGMNGSPSLSVCVPARPILPLSLSINEISPSSSQHYPNLIGIPVAGFSPNKIVIILEKLNWVARGAPLEQTQPGSHFGSRPVSEARPVSRAQRAHRLLLKFPYALQIKGGEEGDF